MIYKYDTDSYPQFCYNCWYYLSVKVIDPKETKVRVLFASLPDIGDNL